MTGMGKQMKLTGGTSLLALVLVGFIASATPACGKTTQREPDAADSSGGTAAGAVVECAAARVECNGACRDIQADPAHCGECGHACAAEEMCNRGQCGSSCSPPLTDCDGACVDLLRDPTRCGSCDRACPDDQSCHAGECTRCPDSLAECSGTCRDLAGDWANCGACGHACQLGEVCANAKCALDCGNTRTSCGGNCVELATDALNCGACGTFCAGNCRDGACSIDIVINVTKGANEYSFAPAISGDGRWISFGTAATNLTADGQAGGFVYHDDSSFRRGSMSSSGVPTLVSRYTWVSNGGSYFLFASDRALSDDDTNGAPDLYRVDLETSDVRRVSVYPESLGYYGADNFVSSQDADVIAFQAIGGFRVYARHVSSGTTQWVAPEADDDDTWRPSISGDGAFVAFDTRSMSLTGTGELHVFVENLGTEKLELVSSNSLGQPANAQSFGASLSADGSIVAFQSDASNLTPDDTNYARDVFVKDRSTGSTTRVSVSSDGLQSNDASFLPTVSANGRYVAFLSRASNLAPGDSNALIDVYVFDRQTKKTSRVSVDETGKTGAGTSCQESLFECNRPALSAAGDIVVFESNAGNLVPGSVPGRMDIYRVDWQKLPSP
jgi:Tol biopolymer transport system component